MSVILDPNNHCKQEVFRRILNSVSSYGGIEITLVDRRQHTGIKGVEIKMLSVSDIKKIEMLNKYIHDPIHDPRINKEALFEP